MCPRAPPATGAVPPALTNVSAVILRRFIVEETGCASYLFGCPTTGSFGVVDPHPAAA
jgi:hypothetical protein